MRCLTTFKTASGSGLVETGFPSFHLLFFNFFRSSVSDSAKDLITKLLDKDPKTRLTVDQCLQHPWFVRFVARFPHQLVEKQQRRGFGYRGVGEIPGSQEDEGCQSRFMM